MATEPDVDLTASHDVQRRGGVVAALRHDWTDALSMDALLDGADVTAWGRPVPHSLVGRSAVHVLATAQGEIVAKRLSRGGLMGGLLRESFADAWRPAREAAVAEALLAAGVPTAPVVAWRSTGVGTGLHRLELATARIPGARDLLEVLDDSGVSQELAGQAGRTLRRLHDIGLRHRDLQVKNLLVPAAGAPADLAYIIDLDRCTLGAALDDDERVAALARFARSLVKRGHLPFAPEQPPAAGRADLRAATHAFVRAYGAVPGLGCPLLTRRTAEALARQVRWHRHGWKRSGDETQSG